MNPYGYLNGDEYGFLPVYTLLSVFGLDHILNLCCMMQFYLALAVIYLITTISWGFLLYRYRSGLLALQVYQNRSLYAIVDMTC